MTKYEEYCQTHIGVTWDKYVEDMLDERDKLISVQFAANDKALIAAEKAMDSRLSGWPVLLNNLKSEVDRLSTATVTEKYVNEKIEGITKFAIATLISAIFALLSALTAIIIVLLQRASGG